MGLWEYLHGIIEIKRTLQLVASLIKWGIYIYFHIWSVWGGIVYPPDFLWIDWYVLSLWYAAIRIVICGLRYIGTGYTPKETLGSAIHLIWRIFSSVLEFVFVCAYKLVSEERLKKVSQNDVLILFWKIVQVLIGDNVWLEAIIIGLIERGDKCCHVNNY